MRKKPLITPDMLPKFDIDFNDADLELLSSKEWQKQFKKSKAYEKYVQPMYKEEKERRKQYRRNWWKNNWIQFLGLIFAFIAALPVIFQAICYILKYIA